MNSFFRSHFSYCPLVCTCHSRLHNRINKLLRIIYRHYQKSFDELLNIDKSFTIHERSIQKLATKLFKVKIGGLKLYMNLRKRCLHGNQAVAHVAYANCMLRILDLLKPTLCNIYSILFAIFYVYLLFVCLLGVFFSFLFFLFLIVGFN